MALLGGIETLRTHRPIVVFENSIRAPSIYNFSIEGVISFLTACGYSPTAFNGQVPTTSNWFGFWEMWAAPFERVDELRKTLSHTLADTMAS